ncbi:aberrant root formation protein 4 [Pyrus ussuriensis x Pyrus communis]|uniref:Aberrant root formation protein 4 n=1 Tax=Pyrus ussuriensis x Pyrus communis TaxID=2448454 RepID=A0A5N5HUN8_9ROSA|nr:aberrant root formation protein 4 [Pyrus ussuriensis x Pyrus communis]
MAVWKFGGISEGCLEVAESTIDFFISIETIKDSGYIAPLLTGLSKVVPSTILLIFDRALAIAHSIRSVCVKLEGVANEKLRALLGLYVLQIMAIVSMNHNVTSSQLFVLQLSSFFAFCGLSYLGVITGSDVDKRTREVVGVIWGHASDDVVRAAEGHLTSVKLEPKNNQTERWQAVGMLKHILAPASLPWELKRYTINFLICITDGNISHYDERKDFSSFKILQYLTDIAFALASTFNSFKLYVNSDFNGFVVFSFKTGSLCMRSKSLSEGHEAG